LTSALTPSHRTLCYDSDR